MALPIISGSEVQTPLGGARINAAPLRRADLMVGQKAAALGDDVSSLFSQVSNKFQQNRNAGTLLDADLKMRKLTDDYRDSLQKNPDESTWLPGWQEQARQLREEVMSGHNVGPDVRNQLSRMFDRWDQASGSEIKTAAQLQQLNRTKKTVIADYTYAARSGHGEAAMAAIDLGVKNHALFPEEAARMKREVPQITQRAQVDTGIINNPIATLSLLKDQTKDGHSKRFPAIDPRTLETLVVTAQNAMRKVQIQNAQQWSDQIDDAIDHHIDAKLLQNARDEKAISALDYERLNSRMGNYAKQATREHAAEETAQFNVALLDADTPPSDARDLESWSAEMKSQGMGWTNTAYRKRLNDYVDRKVQLMRQQGQTHRTPVESQIYRLMDEDRAQNGVFVPMGMTQVPDGKPRGWFDAIEFWPKSAPTKQGFVPFSGGLAQLRSALRKATPAQIEQTYGLGMNAKTVLEHEQAAYAGAVNGMREWFQTDEGKNSTFDQANEHRLQLETPIHQGSANLLFARISKENPSAVTESDRQALDYANRHSSEPDARAIFDHLISKYQDALPSKE